MMAMSEPMCPTVKEWINLNSESESRVWIVCGTDLFLDEGQGKCQVHRWIDGERLFSDAHFYIFPRPVKGEWVCPPQAKLVTDFKPMDISSSQLRAKAQNKVSTK
jgi:nicotinic acid mononucleotide adenylyltransferase